MRPENHHHHPITLPVWAIFNASATDPKDLLP
jgi:hypothetical protein